MAARPTKIQSENFEQKPLEAGQNERYSHFKIMIAGEMGAQVVGHVLKSEAPSCELEQKEQRRLQLEKQRDLNRKWERAKLASNQAMEQAQQQPSEAAWAAVGEAQFEERMAEEAAKESKAMQWTEHDKDELREIDDKIVQLAKKRKDDNKGCGEVLKKLLRMTGAVINQDIGKIQAESKSSVEALTKTIKWLDIKFRGHPSTIRNNMEAEMVAISEADNAEDVRTVIDNVTHIRGRMIQSYETHGGDAVRSDETMRGHILNRIAVTAELLPLRMKISGMLPTVSWEQDGYFVPDARTAASVITRSVRSCTMVTSSEPATPRRHQDEWTQVPTGWPRCGRRNRILRTLPRPRPNLCATET
jgi:hypothetical protein